MSFSRLLAFFIGIPLLEILILIKLGEVMGFSLTVLLVIGTGFLGAWAARIQGMKTWIVIQQEMNAGRSPGEPMIDALLIFVAGLLLLTPGLLTDITGFLLLFPATRRIFKQWLRRKFDEALRSGSGGQTNYRFFIGG